MSGEVNPYKSPLAGAPGNDSADPPGYRSARPWTRLTIVLLAACMIVQILFGMAALISAFIWVSRDEFGDLTLTYTSGHYLGLSGGLQIEAWAFLALLHMLLLLPTVGAFCAWCHRSHRNLVPLGARGLRYTPASSIAAFFTPVSNLWRPRAVLGEIWSGSERGSAYIRGSHHEEPFWLRIWWVLWLAFPALAIGVTVLFPERDRYYEHGLVSIFPNVELNLNPYRVLLLLTLLTLLLLVIFTGALVLKITQLQEDRARQSRGLQPRLGDEPSIANHNR